MSIILGIIGCNDSLRSCIEIAEAPLQNGVRLEMGKPVPIIKTAYSSVDVPLEITNLSGDTIYFVNIFVFKEYHPIWGTFEFYISDQDGNTYPLKPASRHYYELARRQSEFVILPPAASYQDTIAINFDRDYNLRKGKTYTIFAQYVNQRLFDTGTFPIRLPSGKQLWTGVLKSNTYKFKL
jgi:hypothetical protein